MKITPLEIRQKRFEKVFRGYDKEEVEAYLASLSGEWERLLTENKGYKIKLSQAEKEVEKLREVESSLFKTLKTAEDTGANIVQQASKASEIQLQETQLKANDIVSKALDNAKEIIDDADMKSREISETLQEEVKELQNSYKRIEYQRDNLLFELKTLSQDILDKVGRFNVVTNKKTVFENSLKKAKNINAKHYFESTQDYKEKNKSKDRFEDKEDVIQQPPTRREEKKGSFFDDLD